MASKYKYNGIELEESLGVNLYEMDLRQYDPTIARWTEIDPVTHYEYSTYNAFDNNPVFWADPSGADGECYTCIDSGSNGLLRSPSGDYIKNNNYTSVASEFEEFNKKNQKKNTATVEAGDLQGGDGAAGYYIVNAYLQHVVLQIFLYEIYKIAMEENPSNVYIYKAPFKSTLFLPSNVARSRNTKGRNSFRSNNNYGSIEFTDDYRVLSINERAGSGDYGYCYSSGTYISKNDILDLEGKPQNDMYNSPLRITLILTSPQKRRMLMGI